MRQRTRAVIGALVIALLAAAPALPGSSAAAATARALRPLTLTMVEGHLLLRDAEPYALSIPTTITGSVDTGEDGTGAITGVTLSTPTLSLTREITSPIPATVLVDAVFSPVAPGVGSVDTDGEVLLQASLRVDLNIRVIGFEDDCVASPVALSLRSTAPYDPAPGRVTLADPDFTIPPVPLGGTCSELIGGEVNALLAGSGHALSLTLEGDIELPPPAGCPTVTEVEVTPGASRLGDEVTLTASVSRAPDTDGVEECGGAPAHPEGFVDFRDGSRIVATLALAEGEAAHLTTALPAGDRRLTARYRGEPPYRASTSAPVTHRVAAPPAVVTDLPDFLQIDAGPVPFTVEVTNTDLGFALAGARLDLTLTRLSALAVTAESYVVEYHDGADWVPVALAAQSEHLVGAVGESFPLGPGEARTLPLRIALLPTLDLTTRPGGLTVSVELVEVDPVTQAPAPVAAPAPAAVATAVVEATAVGATRLPSAVAYQMWFPGFFGGPPAQASTVRQGYVFTVPGLTVTPSASARSGHLEVYVGGQRVPVRRSHMLDATPLADGFLDRIELLWWTNAADLDVALPPDFPVGEHPMWVRYSGNAVLEPSISPLATITVLPAVAPMYRCQSPRGARPNSFGIQVRAHANVAGHALPGAQLDLGQFDVSFVTDRGWTGFELQSTFGTGELAVGEGRLGAITFGLGPVGEGTATGLTRTGTIMEDIEPDPDQTVTFAGETGTVTVDGEPGEVVPVTLDALNLHYTASDSGPAGAVVCQPVGDPVVLGQVALAGTSLSVTPPEGLRAGAEVELTAQVHPVGRPGNVVFSDNGVTIGVAPVGADGTASATWTAAEGSRSLVARFQGGLAVLSTADEVAVQVGPTHDCDQFLDAGSGAVVRLAYLELLGRCPDPAGYDHWTGRLDGGLSAEGFARQIASSTEALGRVVDDGYRTILGREADAAGREFWVGRLRGSGRYDQLLADLAASGEFWDAAGGSNAGFVDRVYERVLGRPAEDADRSYWAGRLAAGDSRRVLVRTLARLAEPLGVIVDGAYGEILSRAPFAAERDAAITRLRADGDRSALSSALLGAAEFRARAQTFPNPED